MAREAEEERRRLEEELKQVENISDSDSDGGVVKNFEKEVPKLFKSYVSKPSNKRKPAELFNRV